MRKQSKKIIAREFLLLILTVVVSVVVFLFTYICNSYHTNASEKIENKIFSMMASVDSLVFQFNNKTNKQTWFYNKINEIIDVDEYVSAEKLWEGQLELAKIDSIRWPWLDKNFIEEAAFLKKIGFESDSDVRKFILVNTISELDSSNRSKSVELRNEIKNLEKSKINHEEHILTFKDQIVVLQYSMCTLLFIFFIFRYLIYSIKWSIKTLREKTD